MHGQQNINFGNAKQAKQTHQYKNNKTQLYKTNVAIWHNLRKEINILKKLCTKLALFARLYKDARPTRRKKLKQRFLLHQTDFNSKGTYKL